MLARLKRLDVVLNDTAEEEMDLLIPIHRAFLLLLFLIFPVPLELVILHTLFECLILKLHVLLFVLEPEDFVFVIDAIVSVHILCLLLCVHQKHERA